jgi:hypothetical protein
MEDNETITLTAEELDEKIKDAVEKAVAETTETLNKKHSDEMAQQRKKAKADTEKAVEQAVANANLSAEEQAAKKIEEERRAEQEELAQLRLEKKINDRANKLKEKGLPDFFKNDSRLLNANDEEVDSVIATIEKEYKGSLPQGATVSTNVSGTSTGGNAQQTELERVRKLGLGK